MTCIRCHKDPQPANFGSPRQCAFDEHGQFTAENWQCATLAFLREACREQFVWSREQSCGVVATQSGQFIMLGYYKSRGRTEAATYMDEKEVRTLTLSLAEQWIRESGGGAEICSELGGSYQDEGAAKERARNVEFIRRRIEILDANERSIEPTCRFGNGTAQEELGEVMRALASIDTES